MLVGCNTYKEAAGSKWGILNESSWDDQYSALLESM